MEEYDNSQFELKTPRQNEPYGEKFITMARDINFLGFFTIAYGALISLTIIGLFVGIPLIIAGIGLRNAAFQFKQYELNDEKAALREGFFAQAKYFSIMKILIIISIVFAAVYFISIFTGIINLDFITD
ncbi:MAG: DUF5362 domain-containing protein [Bacteroidetes bacterium]|nr:DUF5362 domain-containing protein [Bacteroidota bacterium]MBU1679908.1 DUF5362 domain-containing protein [Bacteroidota bacterium]MBU2506231.1 DUF5362 domain-containing protein [Bacteroidota bacterium]